MAISVLLFIPFMLADDEKTMMKYTTVLINWCYILFFLALLVTVVFSIVGMAKDMKSAKFSLIGIGGLIIIYIIGYVFATDETYTVADVVVEGVVSRYSEAGLISFYIMIFLAIGTIVYTEISKAFK